MLAQNKLKLLSIYVRYISTTSRFGASHYDVLGITPKATQNDIKTAYYELSKKYHPDKSKDEESAKKFRQICEAYEVLGNVSLKKMYDKGLIVGKENTSRMDYQPEPEPTDPTLKFYKSREHKNVVPTMDGHTPVFDFDAWSKQHYGNLIKKRTYAREFVEKQRKKEVEISRGNHQEAVFYLFLVCFFFFMVAIGKSDFDDNKIDETKIVQDSNKATVLK
ncbi:unnamed protein product [Danaus chrysippus]|uniref:(African queen) hypothetical protein n=1 Tax=Danaus chrysippus TaxID=151541 RepID=A0A8J2VXX4_9NEOP|nr:unnamed protein product [Danaus chrysippus]